MSPQARRGRAAAVRRIGGIHALAGEAASFGGSPRVEYAGRPSGRLFALSNSNHVVCPSLGVDGGNWMA